ncbi:MAG: 3-hydroxyacyl-CoA dehydrogenase [Rhodospirillaceae bacterium]|nr:3-hydroxyacyl-CoA dehydrogenase [Alphaproteobacteria bacterium]MBR73243.1 3-hydroxyacyl-CoA dehydrogenase [Rhodospirillaceae bacterium]|tara:strand:+ start:2539 stop:3306 length:768 start_codon:yes stop_codon:yes gene_type:complete
MNISLEGKHAIITGGAHGIGGAISRALYEQGVNVSITGRDQNKLEQAQKLMPLSKTYSLDITNEDSVNDIFNSAINNYGSIDILINNAGIANSAPFLKIQTNEVRQIMEINLVGLITCSQAALPHMLEKNWGRIINISSLAGIKGQPYLASYCASKHAVIGVTRSLATELIKSNITVNAICPGYVETDMVKQAVNTIVRQTGRTTEEARNELKKINPQGRIIKPKEIATTAVWLCMPESESITGQAIAIAGGEWM